MTTLPTDRIPPADAEAYAAHAEALALRDAVRRSEHGLAVVLARIAAKKLHHALGYAHVFDYAEHALACGAARPRVCFGSAARSTGCPSWTAPGLPASSSGQRPAT